jgi:protein kinase C substrate 80K-H
VDGSDEPGTSACSHTAAVFHCINAGFFPSDLPTSRVNDGVCDCCDGSDEYASGASCASRCDEEMQSFRADRKDLIEQVEAGLRDRVALAAEAQKFWDEEQQKQQQLEASAASLRVTAEQLEARKEEEERLEREEKESRVAAKKHEMLAQLGLAEMTKEQLQAIILEIGRQGVSAKHELLPIIRQEREAAHEGDVELPKTPMDELDEAFRERDDARQKETRRIEKLLEERRKEQDKKAQEAKEALEKAAAAAAVAANGDENTEAAEAVAELEAADIVAEPEIEAPVAVEEEAPEDEDLTLPEVEARPIDLLYEELAASERYERSEAVLTRKQHEDTKKELAEEEKKVAEAQKLLQKDYGVDHLFFALRDKCVETEAGKYKYKMCFFGKATQDHTKLGDMEDIKGPEPSTGEESGEDATPAPHEVAAAETVVREIKFSKGQKCWNGPHRSLAVTLECGPEPMQLSDIEEPSTCVYSAKLRTPAVCSEDDRERIMTFDAGSARVAPHHIEVEVLPTL